MLHFLLLTVASAVDDETWVGHQVTISERKVPLLGTVTTRQDVWMLADVQHDGDNITLTERPCAIHIKSGRNIELSFSPAGVRDIPETHIAWIPTGDGQFAASWTGGWGTADIDHDGVPGIRVDVSAPVCGGHMAVATRTRTEGTARAAGGGLDGTVSIALDRSILATSNGCLALVPKRSAEQIRGTFTYRPIQAGTECGSLNLNAWPVQVR